MSDGKLFYLMLGIGFGYGYRYTYTYNDIKNHQIMKYP